MKTIIFLQCSYRPSQLINLKDNLILNSNIAWSAQILVQLRLLWSRSGGEIGQIKSKPNFKSCKLYWCKIGSAFWTDRQTPSELVLQPKLWRHRCWWRMLETKCVGDNLEMLVTVLAIFVSNILFLWPLLMLH